MGKILAYLKKKSLAVGRWAIGTPNKSRKKATTKQRPTRKKASKPKKTKKMISKRATVQGFGKVKQDVHALWLYIDDIRKTTLPADNLIPIEEELKKVVDRVGTIESLYHEILEEKKQHSHRLSLHTRKLSKHEEKHTDTQLAIERLQQQFADLIDSEKELAPNELAKTTTETVKPPQVVAELPATTPLKPEKLTPLEETALALIGVLLNQSRLRKLTSSALTKKLYPEKDPKKMASTVSNVLKGLEIKGFIGRERKPNRSLVELTMLGFAKCRELVSDHKLDFLTEQYHN